MQKHRKKKSGGAPETETGPRPNAELPPGGVPGSPAAVGGISSRARPDPARRRPAGGDLEGAFRPPRAVFFFFPSPMERSQFVGADGKKKFPEIPPRAATNDPEAAGRGAAGDPGICIPYYGSAGLGVHPRPLCQGDCGESSST